MMSNDAESTTSRNSECFYKEMRPILLCGAIGFFETQLSRSASSKTEKTEADQKALASIEQI